MKQCITLVSDCNKKENVSNKTNTEIEIFYWQIKSEFKGLTLPDLQSLSSNTAPLAWEPQPRTEPLHSVSMASVLPRSVIAKGVSVNAAHPGDSKATLTGLTGFLIFTCVETASHCCGSSETAQPGPGDPQRCQFSDDKNYCRCHFSSWIHRIRIFRTEPGKAVLTQMPLGAWSH